MKHFVYFIMSLILLLPAHSMGADRVVSLATTEWEPYVGERLANYGFTSESIIEAFKRVGYKVTFNFKPPKRVMAEVESGVYDAGYLAYYSDERARRFDCENSFSATICRRT